MNKVLSSVLLLLALHSNAQQKIFEFAKPGILIEKVEAYADDRGGLAVVYTTKTESLPRVYKTYFLFNGTGGPKELLLPVHVRVFAVTETDDRFAFYLRTQQDDSRDTPQFDIFEMDKNGEKIHKTFRFNFDKETVLTSFNSERSFLIVTLLKKTKELRVRIFKGASEPTTITYKTSESMFEELKDIDGVYSFAHNEFELSLEDVYEFRKAFIHEAKLYLRVNQKPGKNGTIPGLSFLELSLKPEAPSLVRKELLLPHKSDMSCFPLNGHLFLYKARRDSLFLGIASLSSFTMVKKYAKSNGWPLLRTRVYKEEQKASGFLTLDLGGKFKQPADSLKKLKLLAENEGFVYPLLTSDGIRVSFGQYEFQVSGGGTMAMPGGTSTYSTPYGTVTHANPTRYVSAPTTEASTPDFVYMVAYLNPDFTIANWIDREAGPLDQMKNFVEDGANKKMFYRTARVQTKTYNYLLGYSTKEDTFRVWSFPSN